MLYLSDIDRVFRNNYPDFVNNAFYTFFQSKEVKFLPRIMNDGL